MEPQPGNKREDSLIEEIQRKDKLIASLLEEKQKLEDSLQQRNAKLEHLESIFDLVPGAFFQFEIDALGKRTIAYFSRSAENVYNRPLPELMNFDILVEAVHPKDLPGLLLSIDHSKNELSLWDYLFRVRKGVENSYMWIHGKSIPKKLKDESVVWNGILIEATRQKEYEKEVQTQKEIAENYLNISAEIILQLDRRGKIVLLNDSGHELLGYKKGELIGKNWFDIFVSEKVRQIEYDNFIKAIEREIVIVSSYEMEIRTKSGDLKTILWHNSPLVDDDKIIGLLSSGEDITLRRKAEQELQERNSFLNAIIDSSLVAMWVADKDGTIIRVNKYLLDHINVSEDALVGKFNVFTDENLIQQGLMPQVKEVFTKKKPTRFTISWSAENSGYAGFNKSNSPWADIVMFPILDKNGNLTNVVCQWLDITEQKGTEFALKESEKIFHNLFNHLNSGVAVFDVIGEGEDFIFKFFNKAAERIEEKGAQNLIGKSVFEARPELLKYGLIAVFKDVVKTKKTQHYPLKVYKNTVLEKYYENYIFLLPTGELVAVFDDFTERLKFENELKRAKEEAIRNELRYRKAQEIGHVGSWEFDIQKQTFWGSDETKRIYNLKATENEFLPEDIKDCIVEEDKERTVHAFRQLIRKKIAYDIVFTIIPQNTNDKRIIHSIAELEYKENLPVKVSGVLRDVTLRTIIEKELVCEKEKAEETGFRLELAVESGKLGIWDWDIQKDILVWNKKMFELYGISEKDFGGTLEDWSNVVHHEDRRFVRMELDEALAQNREFSTTFRIVQPDKNTLHLKVDAVVIRNEKKEPIRMIGINRDITELVSYQNELIKAKEKAEEADKLKSAFLANMSHEIRTPMNGILGFTDLLIDPGLSGEEQQKYIEVIQKSSERLLNTVNDIIEISRIETGEVITKISTIDINKSILCLCDFFSLEAKKKGLKLVVDSSFANELYVETDEFKINSVVSNLLKNAIKYTLQGQISIGYLKKKNFLEFYVSDTGIGIPENRKEAIFNRFEQADIGDSRVFEGSGLGLSISKSYVEMLGGDIWVESEINEGSTFYFSIPFKNSTVQVQDNTSSGGYLTDEPKAGFKVLIVEDDEVSKAHLKIILKSIAREMLYARTGIEAIELTKKHPDLELILMDIKMPEMNGIEAVKEIRKFNKQVPIIAQTAFAFEEDKHSALEAGCDNYISKPIIKNELISLIEKYVQQ